MELNKVGVVITEESSSRMKNVLSILLAIHFVVSLTAVTVMHMAAAAPATA
jgi:hypothetical protein